MRMSAKLEPKHMPMWQVERTAHGDVMHFGRNRFLIGDVAAVSGEVVGDTYADGLLLGAFAFLLTACALAFGVFDGGLRPRFLLGTAFLGLLGFAGLSELISLKRQRWYEIKITLASGKTLNFTSADRADVDVFMARLQPAA
jgi:Family of unknown function (DUF6232)